MDSSRDELVPLVVFWFPGLGLGRLVRALAIARHLKSPYRIYGSATSLIDVARREDPHVYNCCKGALEELATLGVGVMVTDTWPYNRQRAVAQFPAEHVLVARRCNGERNFGLGLDAIIDPNDHYIIIRQPEEWSVERGERILGRDRPVLAFHSARPEQETIFQLAGEIAQREGRRLVCLTPEEYFPVCELLPAAGHVVCAAGYNSFAETQAWGGPVTYVPMHRDYDDQEGRLSERPRHFDGALLAAEEIDEQLRG